MKFILQSICLIAALLVCAQADHIDKDAQVLSERSDPADAEGNYAYAFQTSNGIQSQEAGNINGVSGSYGYTSPDGQTISLTYTADENGFHPVGDHLPTPPPIPDHVVRLLEYIAAHPPQ